ncbi:MAG: DUF551 domain-containing protein [Nanoarchaeota archaeon]
MEWVNIKDKTPEIGEWFLVFIESEFNEKKFHVGKYEGFESFEIGHCPGDYYGERSERNINFWMPLPPPPN